MYWHHWSRNLRGRYFSTKIIFIAPTIHHLYTCFWKCCACSIVVGTARGSNNSSVFNARKRKEGSLCFISFCDIESARDTLIVLRHNSEHTTFHYFIGRALSLCMRLQRQIIVVELKTLKEIFDCPWNTSSFDLNLSSSLSFLVCIRQVLINLST